MTLSSATLPATETTPYVGLRPFLKEEALKFYGRGEHIFAMLEILKRRHYLAVVGSSGSGKSSLVRAGLLPALEDGHFDRAAQWRFVQMRPGRAPYENLLTELLLVVSPEDVVDADTIAARRVTLRSGPRGLLEVVADCLLPENTRVLVLVDQFEEIFRFLERGNWSAATDGRMSDHQRDTALAFVDMLLTTIAARDPRVLIVLTMRSDYLGECEAFLGLSAAISKAQFLTPRMTREELTDVIQCPIEAAGGSIDRAVVNELLNAVGSAQDTLPRLEHVLLRMWNLACAGRKGDAVKITEDQYRDPHCGGFENALDKHADEIFESLNDSSRRIAELLFRSLSERTAEGRLIRRLRTIREIAEIAHTDQTPVSPQSVIQVAQKFVRPGVNFLVPSPACSLMADTTLDVSHESLLRQWQRLGRWVDVESKAADDLRQLVRDAQRWERGDKGYLQPPELDLYEAWRAKSAPTASWAKRYVTLEQFQLAEHYLTASAADWKHRLETEAAGQRRLRWYLKLALTAAAAAGVATLVAVLALFWALDQRNEAVAAEGRAVTAREEAETQRENAIQAGIRSEELREQAVEARNSALEARNEAEKAVGSGWVHSLGHTEAEAPLNPIEMNTLWDLATSENARFHEQFLITGLRGRDDARHLRRRLEVAVQADVGLRDDRRAAIRKLIIEKLQNPRNHWLSLKVCVDIGLALQLTDSAFSAQALNCVAETRATNRWSDDERVFLANHVDHRDAGELAKTIIEFLKRAGAAADYEDVRWPELPILIGRLQQPQGSQLATASAEFLVKNATSDQVVSSWLLSEITQSYASIAKYLEPDDAKKHAAALAKTLEERVTSSSHSTELKQIADSLILLDAAHASELSDAAKKIIVQLRTLATRLETSSEIAEPELKTALELSELAEVSQSFIAIERFMTVDEVTAIVQSLARACLRILARATVAMSVTDDEYRVADAVLAFGTLARLPTETIDKIVQSLYRGSIVDRQFLLIHFLILAMDRLADRNMAPAESEELLQQLARRILFAGKQDASGPIREVLASIGNRLNRSCRNFLRMISMYVPEWIRPYVYEPGIVITEPRDLEEWSRFWEGNALFPPLFDVTPFKTFLRGASKNERAELAHAMLRWLARTDERPRENIEYFPAIYVAGVELPPLGLMMESQRQGRPYDSRNLWQRAHAFVEVADALEAPEAVQAARTILDQAEHTDYAEDVAGLAKMLISLAPRFSREDAVPLAKRIALRFGTIRDENIEISLLHAFRALATTLPTEDLVELLKWPNCVGFQRSILLVELGKQEGQDFATNWDFVTWAKESKPELYKTLKSPPLRPSDEEVRAGPRFEPPTQPEPAPTSPEPPPLPVPDR